MFPDAVKHGWTAGLSKRGRGPSTLAWGVLAALLLSGVPGHAIAQTAPPSRTYRIVVGDVLQVDVVGRADISGEYTVEKQGTIRIPVVGVVTAEGRTTTELGTDISRRISLTSTDIPQVNVSVVQAFKRKVFVLGAVLLPGSYSFNKAPTVWEAISEAGGASDDGDLAAVQVIAESQVTPTLVDVATALRSGDLGSLPRLSPGATVRVPRLRSVQGPVAGSSAELVYVFGAVGTQGAMPLADVSDLMRAVIRSSPAIDADLKRVEIVRKTGPGVVSMRVNLKDYIGGASVVGNPQLQPGDTIFLPRQAGTRDYLRVIGVLLGLATSIAILTNN